MKFCIVVLFAFLATFTGANSRLSCYSCYGNYKSDCAKNKTGSEDMQICHPVSGQKENWCVYVKWQDNPILGNMVERGCRSVFHYKFEGYCEELMKRYKTVVDCRTCTYPFCNA